MSTTSIILEGVVDGASRRTLVWAFLPLTAILSATPLSAAEEAPPGPSARMAADPASGGLQVELFRRARKPTPHSPVAHANREAAMRPILLPIVGAVRADMCERLDAVNALGRGLSREEIALLWEFLSSPPAAQEKNVPDLEGLKNDILNVLRRQSPPPSGFTETLIGIYRDPAQDSVIRDYAIQHLVVWYEQGAPDTPQARDRIRAALFEAAGESGSIAGTALLGLHLLSAEDPALGQDDINRVALRLVCSAKTQVASRITAIQVCAERGLKEAVPAIQAVAEAQGCVPLRLSALAALARLNAGQQARALGRVWVDDDQAAPAGARVAYPQPEQKPVAF